MRAAMWMVAVVTVCTAVVPVRADEATAKVSIHVARTGDDRWSGRLSAPNADRTDGPLATPAAARDAVRRVRATGGKRAAVEVVLHAGRYELEQPLRLEAPDGGTAEQPIVWRAHGIDRVILTGARRIGELVPLADEATLARLPAEARGKVKPT